MTDVTMHGDLQDSVAEHGPKYLAWVIDLVRQVDLVGTLMNEDFGYAETDEDAELACYDAHKAALRVLVAIADNIGTLTSSTASEDAGMTADELAAKYTVVLAGRAVVDVRRRYEQMEVERDAIRTLVDRKLEG